MKEIDRNEEKERKRVREREREREEDIEGLRRKKRRELNIELYRAPAH